MTPIKVLIVDDSAVVRQVLAGVFSADPALQVIGAAADPIFAREKMRRDWPDVIVLDVEMPRMDGITFLRRIMEERPTPVVICSTLTEQGAQTTLDALSAGAVEIITKPRIGLKDFLGEASADLCRAVKAAANARLGKPVKSVGRADPGIATLSDTTDKVVALGTSTGGTRALEQVLIALPEVCPGIVVVQHMPEQFTAAFAERLDRRCECEVREAQDGDRVRPGRVLIAPGGLHMRVSRSGAHYRVDVRDGPRVNRHKPSVDVLFQSVARVCGANAIGIIMTGMGDDGARGLLEMRQAGAPTYAQDEESCVVFGMPKEAFKRGGTDRFVSLSQIPKLILQHKSLKS